MRNYLNNLGMRSRVVLLISGVVFVLLTSLLAVVAVQSRKQVSNMVNADLKSRGESFSFAEQYRMRDRTHMAAMSGMRLLLQNNGAFPTADQACASLERSMTHNGSDPNDKLHPDIAALQDEAGTLIAIATPSKPCEKFSTAWPLPRVRQASAKPLGMTTWESPEHYLYVLYEARVRKPVAPGPGAAAEAPQSPPLGTVTQGFVVDNEAAQKARARSGYAVDVVYWHEESSSGKYHILGASNPAFAAALEDQLPRSLDSAQFFVGGEKYILQQVKPSPENVGIQFDDRERVHTGLVESYTAKMAPFRKLERDLAILAIVSALIGVLLGIIFVTPLVKPLVGLAEVANAVKLGKYDAIHAMKSENRGPFESENEIGVLCRAFEDMIAGVKKRQAMSKFMSNSAFNSLGDSGAAVLTTQRKWMAVMFTDIRGFTKYSEGRDPETVVERLNRVLSIQAQCVARNGGDIDKFIGDAMVAWFSGNDRCQQAIAAATEMVAQLHGMLGDAPEAQIGIGLHVGEVIVGAVGSDNRQDYTAIGSNVNLASRLCSAAGPGQILVSQAVAREVGDAERFHPLAPASLKGFTDPIAVYEVVTTLQAPAPTSPIVNPLPA